MRRPNIVLFMADQLSAFALENYGNETVSAPNIAKLSGEGVTFQNAYCNYPICAPSRYSMLSGRLPYAIGAYDNATELPASVPTMMHYLRLLGYHTTLCGKMHFVGPDQMHGFNERLITDIYPADFAWVPNWKEGPRNAPTGVNLRGVVEAGACVRSLQLDFDEETMFLAIQKVYDLARTPREQPFFLTVSLTHPHSPFTATQEHWDRYDHDKIDMPKTGPIPLEDLDTHSRWLYYSHGRDRLEITPEHVRNARHAYYGMISYVDDKVGQLISLLRQFEMMDDTIFVFLADHGEMMGERGMWYKQTFFEHSARVPMIICGPGLPKGKVVNENVSLVDLMPTLLSLADNGKVEVVTPIDGADMTALMTSGDSGWSDRVFSEYSDMGVCAPCRMIREGQYKYSYVHGHESLLFDLAADPLEGSNLSGQSHMAAIEARLHSQLLDCWDPDDMNTRILESQAIRQLVRDSTKDGPGDNWSYEIRNGDQQRFVRGGGASAGTTTIKGRARFPYIEPVPMTKPKPIPEIKTTRR